MNVGQICNRDVVSAPASATLSDVVQLMRERHTGAVVITKSPLDEPVPVGILTDRDIVFAQLDQKADLSRTRAEDVMTRDPLVLSEDDSIEDAILRLRARGVRRAPVVTAHGKLAGFIGSGDLIAHVARELTVLAHAIEHQPRHEAQ